MADVAALSIALDAAAGAAASAVAPRSGRAGEGCVLLTDREGRRLIGWWSAVAGVHAQTRVADSWTCDATWNFGAHGAPQLIGRVTPAEQDLFARWTAKPAGRDPVAALAICGGRVALREAAGTDDPRDGGWAAALPVPPLVIPLRENKKWVALFTAQHRHIAVRAALARLAAVELTGIARAHTLALVDATRSAAEASPVLQPGRDSRPDLIPSPAELRACAAWRLSDDQLAGVLRRVDVLRLRIDQARALLDHPEPLPPATPSTGEPVGIPGGGVYDWDWDPSRGPQCPGKAWGSHDRRMRICKACGRKVRYRKSPLVNWLGGHDSHTEPHAARCLDCGAEHGLFFVTFRAGGGWVRQVVCGPHADRRNESFRLRDRWRLDPSPRA